ncbi:MAG: alpha-1,2-fucosyltransferase [Oscillospiraceae bacterium]|nr:alpha-1,2-fucosyltransferase [Oscillospiraceae bacterium]
MLVVSFSEGLGNQMFQYALYSAIRARRGDVKAELSFFEDYEAGEDRPPRSYALGCFPAVKPDFASKEELASLEDISGDFLSQARRKLFGQRGHIRAESYPTRFEPDIFEAEGVILRGFWQNPMYFEGIEESLRRDFTFAPLEDGENLELLARIESSESAALHIRRGDYLKHEEVFGGVCTRDYYEKAADIVSSKAGAPLKWFVFTDEPEWAKENIKIEAVTVADINSGENSWKDMLLMSRCRHIICANSSFSWWAAWLARDAKAIVAPAYGPRRRPIPYSERVAGWNYID